MKMDQTNLSYGKIKDVEVPIPINRESIFNYNELFFSVTDPKSNITYANDTFIRICKYEPGEIIGRLHKIIRHPDMPRAVFHIFWEFLLHNKPIAAYVKNMAKDGSYYWVMATAFPCNGGYLSVRLKPGSPMFTKVKAFYQETLQLEKQLELRGDKKQAMLSAREHLIGLIRNEGFKNYEDFMWNALQSEMAHREACVKEMASTQHSHSSLSTATTDHSPASMKQLEKILSDLVMSLEGLKKIHGALAGNSEYILKLARSIMVLSLNAQIGSSKLNQEDLSLAVVAEKMGEQSIMGERRLLAMKQSISNLNELIGTLNFDIISAKLQVEMTIDFLRELNQKKDQKIISILKPDDAVQLLFNAYLPRLHTISDNIGHISEYLQDLLSGVKDIERFIMVLRFIHITGKVEIARMNEQSGAFSTTFQELIQEIETAENHLNQLSQVVEHHREIGTMYSGYKEQLSRITEQMT